MSAGPTSSRVLEDLRQLLASGELGSGEHLDPVTLGARLGSSTTPVREALNRLTGEGLVETRQGSGFQVPLADEVMVHDLYMWIGSVVAIATRQRSLHHAIIPAAGSPSDGYANRTASLFMALASASGNREHANAMSSANARIHAFRLSEPEVLKCASDELMALEEVVAIGNPAQVRSVVTRYVRRRADAARRLVRHRFAG